MARAKWGSSFRLLVACAVLLLGNAACDSSTPGTGPNTSQQPSGGSPPGGISIVGEATWQPPFSPIAFSVDTNGHFSVAAVMEFVTPIGVFSLSAQPEFNNPQYEGDSAHLILFLQNHRTNDVQVFKINSDLDDVVVTAEGRVAITVSANRYVIIDVTNVTWVQVQRKDAALQVPQGRIAFSSRRGSDRYAQIYLMNADGSGVQRLTGTDARNQSPDWSPDGQQIIFTTNAPDRCIPEPPAGDLQILDLASNNTPHPILQSMCAVWPRWSPDGAWIVFTAMPPHGYPGSEDIYRVRPDGSDLQRLTTTAGADAYPAWTIDGRIVFASSRDTNGVNFHLYEMAADGTDVHRLTYGDTAEENAAVSPDGSQIAFVLSGGGDHIFLMNRDGSNMRQLTSGPGLDLYPRWSPDGQWIVFHSNRDMLADNNNDIYVMPLAGGLIQRLTADPDSDYTPSWHW